MVIHTYPKSSIILCLLKYSLHFMLSYHLKFQLIFKGSLSRNAEPEPYLYLLDPDHRQLEKNPAYEVIES